MWFFVRQIKMGQTKSRGLDMQNDYKKVTYFIQFFKNNNKNKGGNTRAESVVHAWRAVKGDDGEKIRKDHKF